jgi:hypothetical protein
MTMGSEAFRDSFADTTSGTSDKGYARSVREMHWYLSGGKLRFRQVTNLGELFPNT